MPETDERNPVEVLAEEYLTLFRQGREPALEEFVAGHPEHEKELRELLPAMLTLERAKRDKESTGSGRARLGLPRLERLGDFRILREVGRGGMGIVFEAEQESLGRRVALKVLPRQALLTGHQLQRFEREAQTAARLHHTNIVPVYGTGEHDGFHFYAMQFIDGRGLDKVIAELEAGRRADETAFGPREGSASLRAASSRGQDYWRQVARIGVQVADALHYAHGQGTLHRDIKPSNLLLDRHGTVWITDFGLAKALEQQGLTHSGDVLGTLQYMAPEQLRGEYDVRSEVYALGLTLYELLTRRPAFSGRNRSEVLDKIQNSEPPAPRRVDPEIPADLETIVLKAIAKEPALRYADAGALREDLERFLEDRPILARRASAPEQLWRWCRRNKALASLAAATLVAVLGAAVVGWSAFVFERRATARAEGNLNLALAAFEDVFDALAGPDPFQALEEDPETGEYQPVLRTAVSEQNAQVLLGLLGFYDRFAQQNAGHRALLADTADAYRRVGDIQQRLGRLEQAEAAYSEALKLYGRLQDRDVRAEIASVHNELGQLERRRRRLEPAEASFRAALEILTGEPGAATRRQRYELARTHYLLASTLDWRGFRRGGRGGRPPAAQGDSGSRRERARAHHLEAARLVEGLLAEEPENPELLRLQARCEVAFATHLVRAGRRDEVERTGAQAEARAAVDRALSNLEALVERFPEADSYRYELVETYSSLAMPRRGSRSDPQQMLSRLRSAMHHAEVLVRRRPDLREYHSALMRAAGGFGQVVNRMLERDAAPAELDRQALLAEAEKALLRALREAELVAGQGDSRNLSGFWIQANKVELAGILLHQQRLDEAQVLLEEVLGRLDQERQNGFLRGFLARSYRLLARVLRAKGQDDEAEAAETKARELERMRRPERNRPGRDR